MTDSIKTLLEELTSYGKAHIELKYLKKADDEMGFSDVITLVRLLLQWQKYLTNQGVKLHSMFHKDKLELEDTNRMEYIKLFEFTPVLNDIYHLTSTEITFNKDLSQGNVDEILDYINVNFKILIRGKGRYIKH